MAVISRQHGYLFVHTPRTGGTTLSRRVLVPLLDGAQLPGEARSVEGPGGRPLRLGQHVTVPELLDHGLLDRCELDGLLVFTTIRNPFDSLVSLYVKKRQQTDEQAAAPWMGPHNQWLRDLALGCDTFAEFVERRFADNDKPRLLYGEHLVGVDVFLRFERLQQDFDDLVERLGITDRIEIPRRNVTPGREPDHRAYYTDRARRTVETVFAPYLERFGYAF